MWNITRNGVASLIKVQRHLLKIKSRKSWMKWDQSCCTTLCSRKAIMQRADLGNNGESGEDRSSKHMWAWGTPLIGVAGILGMSAYNNMIDEDGNSVILEESDNGGLPEITWVEIKKHKTVEDGIWVTYGRKVYDITEFVQGHPGGEKILLAAGGSIEPFWDVYTIHKTKEVHEILDTMLIGKLKAGEHTNKSVGGDQRPKPYKDEPTRHPAFIINTLTPFDAETPPELLVDHYKTPNNLFYVRNHLPVPVIKKEDYKLTIQIPGSKELSFTFEDLKTKFEKHQIVATMQCAGNRRAEMNKHRKIYGAQGGFTAISNASWGGVLLRDVLLELGLDEKNNNLKHIQFEGYDQDTAGENYAASLPLDIAMRAGGDVMLAYEMNGEDLPPDHGYPIRLVVPGVIGARNVKWLKTIKVMDAESSSFFQKKDYRMTPPSAKWEEFDFGSTNSHPIYYSPVQSAICTPKDGATVDADSEDITVRGYAFSGGGNGIVRVDVSINGGETWHSAHLLPGEDQALHKNWAWTLWEVTIPMPSREDGKSAKIEISCKATDTFHNVQPDNIEGIWNLRGFLNNSWHRISVLLQDQENN